MQNKLNKTNIVIVNNALRLIDNPLLKDLNGPTIFVFAMTPYYFSKAHYTNIPNVGENRLKYLFACLTKFREQLDKIDGSLLVLEGTYKQVVDQIVSAYNSNANVEVRVLHQPYAYEIAYEHELLESEYNLLNNKVSIIKDGMTLFPVDILIDIYKQNKSKSFKDFHFSCLRKQQDIKWTELNYSNIICINEIDVQSTEHEADSLNFFYDLKGIENYKENKNLISGNTTTKLEGSLSLGTISKVTAYGLTLNYKTSDADKTEFIRSLIWEDYCWAIAEVEGSSIFKANGIGKDLNKGKIQLIPDWIKGTGTEVKFYNKAMRKLREEGYLNNRTRMLLGSYIIKVLGYSPLALAEYFEHYLCGFNPANNWLGAHSCNGTGVDTIVGGRSFNIRKQLEQYDLDGDYK